MAALVLSCAAGLMIVDGMGYPGECHIVTTTLVCHQYTSTREDEEQLQVDSVMYSE